MKLRSVVDFVLLTAAVVIGAFIGSVLAAGIKELW